MGRLIADRYPKRRLLLTRSRDGRLALLLGVLALPARSPVWQVYLIALGLGLATVVDNPTRQTFVTEMVARTVSNAIGLNTGNFKLARIPARRSRSAASRGRHPGRVPGQRRLVRAALVGLELMRPSELHPVARGAPGARPAAGSAGLRQGPPQPVADPGADVLRATFGMNFQVTTALMSRGVFHTGAAAFGPASAAFAVGALGGALLAARRARPACG